MADLVNQIKQNLPDGCFAKGKLSKEGCTVSLKGAPRPSIKIDMDNKTVLVKQGETKCDYIFIGGCDDVFLVPLELMKGKLDASKVVKQLQAGANIAAARIIPKREQVQFQPVAVCGKFHRAEKEKLSKPTNRIRFKGERLYVQLLKCDQPLVEALPKRR